MWVRSERGIWKVTGKKLARAIVYPCMHPVLHPSFPSKRRDVERSGTRTPADSEGPSRFFTSTSVWTIAAKPHHVHSDQTCFMQGSACIHWYGSLRGTLLHVRSLKWFGCPYMAQYSRGACTLAKHHPPSKHAGLRV